MSKLYKVKVRVVREYEVLQESGSAIGAVENATLQMEAIQDQNLHDLPGPTGGVVFTYCADTTDCRELTPDEAHDAYNSGDRVFESVI